MTLVLASGTLIDVQLALGAVEAATTRALSGSYTSTAILARSFTNCYF